MCGMFIIGQAAALRAAAARPGTNWNVRYVYHRASGGPSGRREEGRERAGMCGVLIIGQAATFRAAAKKATASDMAFKQRGGIKKKMSDS